MVTGLVIAFPQMRQALLTQKHFLHILRCRHSPKMFMHSPHQHRNLLSYRAEMVLMLSQIWSIPHQKFHSLRKASEFRQQMAPITPAIASPLSSCFTVKVCSFYLQKSSTVRKKCWWSMVMMRKEGENQNDLLQMLQVRIPSIEKQGRALRNMSSLTKGDLVLLRKQMDWIMCLRACRWILQHLKSMVIGVAGLRLQMKLLPHWPQRKSRQAVVEGWQI